MLWTYRIVCILIIGAIIPSLRCVIQSRFTPENRSSCLMLSPCCSRKRWNKWFVKQRKSFACTVHVGGLSGA